jgi:hypothetical protein
MADWSETYPAVSSAFDPAYRLLPQAEVEQVIRGVFGESADLATAEGFFDDVGKAFGSAGQAIGRVAQQAAPVLAKAGAGALSGATSGAALGPYGMLAGALLGGTAGALSSAGKTSPAAGAVGQLAGAASGLLGGGAGPSGAVGQLAGAASGLLGGGAGPSGAVGQLAGAASGLLGGGAGPSGAVGQLVGALASPTVQQALSSMLLGPTGRRSVSTPGGLEIPVAAITNLLGMLAHRASAEWESVAPFGQVDYISEAIDTASPEARAEWLYSQLAPIETSTPPARAAAPREQASSTVDDSWLYDLYDELEAEFYADS